jgi:hypothetical protein
MLVWFYSRQFSMLPHSLQNMTLKKLQLAVKSDSKIIIKVWYSEKNAYHQISLLHFAVFSVIRIVPHSDDQPEGQRVSLDCVESLSGADPSADWVNGEIGRLASCATRLFYFGRKKC